MVRETSGITTKIYAGISDSEEAFSAGDENRISRVSDDIHVCDEFTPPNQWRR
jgi:hypothetical protein